MYRPLHTTHCTLSNKHSTIYTENYVLHTAHCALHTAHCTLHTAHCTVSSIIIPSLWLRLSAPLQAGNTYRPGDTLLPWHYALHTAHFTVYTVHFILHRTHLTLHNANFRLWTAQWQHCRFEWYLECCQIAVWANWWTSTDKSSSICRGVEIGRDYKRSAASTWEEFHIIYIYIMWIK